MGGFVPQVITNTVAIPAQVNAPLAMQAYFQQLQAPSECMAQDGVFVAHMLVDVAETSSGGKRRTKCTVRKFAQRTSMLRASGFPHLCEMLATTVTRSHFANPESAGDLVSDTIANASSVTEEEATAMGGVFLGILNSSSTESIVKVQVEASSRPSPRFLSPRLSPAVATRKLLRTFVALDTMGRKHAWFVPMLTTIALRLQGTSVADRARRRSSVVRPEPANGDSGDGFHAVVRTHTPPFSITLGV
jgi:hypothetical protein